MERVKITTQDKIFYKIDSKESCKVILESNLDKKDLFLDIIELLDDYSKFISKIIIHKSLDEHFESQIQITVSKSKMEPLVKNIRNLNYKELSEVN
ncbi:hypothetical protein TL18_04595 [Methanobrevibacter sp. YE315]|uniref:hypothetical protein n=1 Tax=Methanobrevibacter sp. YE315 TaxID=1609968 RepID=UPI000764E988|nr:hypothetical protein [Methanobrevibacter sp. YE315]AMD17360.1 hypothetical protein TL18_04595 [Methanobrevibacter sp. YE315]